MTDSTYANTLADTTQTDVDADRPEGLAAVRLLQGAVYSNDPRPWQLILTHRAELENYFARIGLILVVDENDGLAYLRQQSDEERDSASDPLPRLVRRIPMSYDLTLLCVLLRDEMRRWEDHDLENERCSITLDALADVWKTLQPNAMDDVQCRRSLEATMKKLETMSFVRRLGPPGEYEICRILKARLPLEKLTALRDQLKNYLQQTSPGKPSGKESQHER